MSYRITTTAANDPEKEIFYKSDLKTVFKFLKEDLNIRLSDRLQRDVEFMLSLSGKVLLTAYAVVLKECPEFDKPELIKIEKVNYATN